VPKVVIQLHRIHHLALLFNTPLGRQLVPVRFVIEIWITVLLGALASVRIEVVLVDRVAKRA
jgi:hypothetical protein